MPGQLKFSTDTPRPEAVATSCQVSQKKEFVGAYLNAYGTGRSGLQNSVLPHGPKFPAMVQWHHRDGRAGFNKERLS